MSRLVEIVIGSGDVETKVIEKDLTPEEQAPYDEGAAAFNQARQARRAAIASIGFDPNDNAADPVKTRQYFQASSTFLNEPTHTLASIASMTELNTRAIRAMWKMLISMTSDANA